MSLVMYWFSIYLRLHPIGVMDQYCLCLIHFYWFMYLTLCLCGYILLEASLAVPAAHPAMIPLFYEANFNILGKFYVLSHPSN